MSIWRIYNKVRERQNGVCYVEPFYYGIPLIVEKEVIESFRFDEYGISREQFMNSVICLTDDNLESIINRTFDWKPYAERAKSIVADFMPEATKTRLAIGLQAFESKPTDKSSIEPLF